MKKYYGFLAIMVALILSMQATGYAKYDKNHEKLPKPEPLLEETLPEQEEAASEDIIADTVEDEEAEEEPEGEAADVETPAPEGDDEAQEDEEKPQEEATEPEEDEDEDKPEEEPEEAVEDEEKPEDEEPTEDEDDKKPHDKDKGKGRPKKFTKAELFERKAEYKDKKLEIKDYFKEIKSAFIDADKEAKKLILDELAELKAELKDFSIGVFAKGKEIDFDKYDSVKPIIKNNRTLIPLRAVAEALGTDVEWLADTKTIILRRDGVEVELTINSKTVYVNGVAKECETAPVIEKDRTLVPVRIISEAFDEDVLWDEASRTIVIDTKEADEPEAK